MMSRESEVTILFASHVPRDECVRRLGRVGKPLVRVIGYAFTVSVPDGTQWHWAAVYGKLLGVERVQYTRPVSVAAPN